MALSDLIAGALRLLGRAKDWILGLFGASGEVLSPDEGDFSDVAPPPTQGIPISTDERPVLQLDGLSVFRTGRVLYWRDGDLSIDYDGAPNTYAPAGVGAPLDKLANAGSAGKWWGIATDAQGAPIVQGPSDPFPGYYVSTTALAWPGRTGTAKYVDSTQISYLALPPVFRDLGAQLGDLALVESTKTGRRVWAIWADVGPRKKLGEGSIQLARALGVEGSALRQDGINVALYTGSGDGKPHTEAELQRMGAQLLSQEVA